MKIALITDQHYGIRGDRLAFLDNQKKFLDNVFFPYLRENNITTTICLGDLSDRRKFVNYHTAQRLRKDFIEPVIAQGDFYWILGNHDIYWRHSLELGAASELARDYPIKIIDKPYIEFLDGELIQLIPWICEQNHHDCMEAINTTPAKILFGHLELQGFEYLKGIINHNGESPEIFNRFDIVCSGHFHHRSSRGGIYYLGASSEHTWADYNDPRGFHCFDTRTKKLDFIKNPFHIFQKIIYDDSKNLFIQFQPDIEFEELTDKIVKIIIKSHTNSQQFDWFMNRVEETKPIETKTITDSFSLNSDNSIVVSEHKDTLTVMRELAAQTNNAVNMTKLDTLFVDLYKEAHEED